MSVLLPEPLGPMMATHSPRRTEKSISLRMCRSPKNLLSLRTSIIRALWDGSGGAPDCDASGGDCHSALAMRSSKTGMGLVLRAQHHSTKARKPCDLRVVSADVYVCSSTRCT